MNNNNEKMNVELWNDFNVSEVDSNPSTVEAYQSFQLFMEQFAQLPKQELIKKGWMESRSDISSLIEFYNDIHMGGNKAFYRKVNNENTAMSRLWVSKVKSSAELRSLIKEMPAFDGISKQNLKEIAQLSVDVENIIKLPNYLEELGIILIYKEALPRTKLDGAVFKIRAGNPVIGISFRYPRLDHFWFTLLHELSHICLHLDTLETPSIYDTEGIISSEDQMEIQADRLAKSSFVSKQLWRNCEPKYNKNLDAIKNFAKEINIHESIVAGMLAREDGNYSLYSPILNKVNIRELIFHDE